MLVCRYVGREEPLAADVVFAPDLPVDGIHTAARAYHLRHDAVAQIAAVVVCQIRVDIPGLGRDLVVGAYVVPRHDTAQRMLALEVLVVVVGVADAQQRDAAPRIDIPCRQAEAVATPRIVIYLLKQVQVAEGAVAVALDGGSIGR